MDHEDDIVVHANNDGRFGTVGFNSSAGLFLGELKFARQLTGKQRKQIAREICSRFPLSIFALHDLPDDHPRVVEFRKKFGYGDENG